MKRYILNDCLKIVNKTLTKHPVYSLDVSSHYMHWSFIIQSNKLIKWGINRNGSPPIYLGHSRRINFAKAKIHSELDAWRKAKSILRDKPFECVNIRVNKSGQLKLSKPCICCETFLESVGCTRVIFSTETGFCEAF